MTEQNHYDDAAKERRRRRLQEMKRLKEMQMRRRRLLKIAVPIAAVAVIAVIIGIKAFNGNVQTDVAEKENKVDVQQAYEGTSAGDIAQSSTTNVETDLDTESVEHGAEEEKKPLYSAKTTENTIGFPGEVASNYGIFIDLDTDTVLAQKNGTTRINPASMTKVLTVLVAAEHLEDMSKLDETFTMTLEITDYGYINDCSSVGFLKEEEVTVRDLFYGTILPSGADAAVGLATYIAGSQDAFVELMNEKLEELGLSDTAHMTNCVGIYDENHYCTPYDMAMIMEAAIDNELCREIMHARIYTTTATEQHPEGITISNWFIRRIEDKDTGGEVICAKTGYVTQSGNCAVSYGKDDVGKEYICVTADAHSSWRCIYDHVELYSQFATIKEEETNDTQGSGDAS